MCCGGPLARWPARPLACHGLEKLLLLPFFQGTPATTASSGNCNGASPPAARHTHFMQLALAEARKVGGATGPACQVLPPMPQRLLPGR